MGTFNDPCDTFEMKWETYKHPTSTVICLTCLPLGLGSSDAVACMLSHEIPVPKVQYLVIVESSH